MIDRNVRGLLALSMHVDLPVDSAIMLGSPGVGVDHAKDLNIPPDRIFAATADHDLIVHGTDPTTDDFGGQVFEVPDGKWPVEDWEMMPAHSQYWDDKPLRSLAGIVTGGKP
ncbi:alpha/beta hydrolase [Streptomyces sp. NRRL F-4474]|uniref:alpha/beta hydrolase n=1 Tax=Streptomyces sp. NRRL F-4474 TaxID=1463851 RepID=UPI001F401E62|nr:alpha/beta hydrolase [Streptomyces sp. NRRL F-4474]